MPVQRIHNQGDYSQRIAVNAPKQKVRKKTTGLKINLCFLICVRDNVLLHLLCLTRGCVKYPPVRRRQILLPLEAFLQAHQLQLCKNCAASASLLGLATSVSSVLQFPAEVQVQR